MTQSSMSLDVHVAISQDTPACWVAQCLGTVRYAMKQASYPIHLHVIDGVAGHIGVMRHHGYGLGTAPYVTCVDDDDYVLPQAFVRLGEVMQEGPDAIFPRELHWEKGLLCDGWQRHHLAVYQRRWLIDHRQYRASSDVAQVKAMKLLDVREIREPLYVHRIYRSKSLLLRTAHAADYQRSQIHPPHSPLCV